MDDIDTLSRAELRVRVQNANLGGTWTASASKGDLLTTLRRGMRSRENGTEVDARGMRIYGDTTPEDVPSAHPAGSLTDAIAALVAAASASAVPAAQPIDADAVRAIATEAACAWAEDAGLSRPTEYVLGTGEKLGKIEGAKHADFDRIARAFMGNMARLLMLVGPTGSGKTYMSGQLAQAFGLPYFALSCSGGMSEAWIVGRVVITGAYVSTPFVDLWRNGGVILIDEVAAMPADVAILLNAALDNGKLLIPCTGEVIERSDRCYIVAADNCWGRTFSSEYTARQPLDYATVNRFACCRYQLDYDKKLERKIMRAALPTERADEALDCLWALRKAQGKLGIERFAVATRQVAGFAVALANGSQSLQELVECLVRDLADDEQSRLFAEAGPEGAPWAKPESKPEAEVSV